jgi:hypothetical protein
VYPQDSFVNVRGSIGFYFMVQTVTSFIFAGQFRGYPYAEGFRLLAYAALGMVFCMAFGLFKTHQSFVSICTGTLLMLEGAIVYGVSLGLQRMARGLPYQYDASTAQSRDYSKR